jgi:hypothetical protein
MDDADREECCPSLCHTCPRRAYVCHIVCPGQPTATAAAEHAIRINAKSQDLTARVCNMLSNLGLSTLTLDAKASALELALNAANATNAAHKALTHALTTTSTRTTRVVCTNYLEVLTGAAHARYVRACSQIDDAEKRAVLFTDTSQDSHTVEKLLCRLRDLFGYSLAHPHGLANVDITDKIGVKLSFSWRWRLQVDSHKVRQLYHKVYNTKGLAVVFQITEQVTGEHDQYFGEMPVTVLLFGNRQAEGEKQIATDIAKLEHGVVDYKASHGVCANPAHQWNKRWAQAEVVAAAAAQAKAKAEAEAELCPVFQQFGHDICLARKAQAEAEAEAVRKAQGPAPCVRSVNG